MRKASYVNQQEHHDRAEELVAQAEQLIGQANDVITDAEKPGIAELEARDRLVSLADTLAAAAQVHATLSTLAG
jgi:hypothetical protein